MIYVPSTQILAPDLLLPGSRPTSPVRLNARLADEYGIVGAWYMLDGGGTRVIDLTDNKHGEFFGTGDLVWRPDGLENHNDGTNTALSLGSITSANKLSGVPTGEVSVFFKCTFSSTINSNYPIVLNKSTASSGNGGWVVNFYVPTKVMDGYIGGTRLLGPACGMGPNVKGSYGWSLKTGDQRFYENGSYLGATTKSITFSTATAGMSLLSRSISTDREICATAHVLLISSKHLSAEEHATIAADPYMFLEPDGPAFNILASGDAPEPSTDVFFDNRIDEISQGSRIQTAAKLGGVLVE